MKAEMVDCNMFHNARYARCFCAEKIGTKIYMYAWEYNALYIYDEETNEIFIQKGNINYDGYIKYLYETLVVYKESIYFTPGLNNSSDILKYNLKSKEKEYLKIDTKRTSYNSVVVKGILYLLPIHYSDKVISIRLDSDEVFYVKIDYGQQLGDLNRLGESTLFYGVEENAHAIWRACLVAPFVQKYYYEEERFEYIRVNGVEDAFISIAYDGHYFWLLMLKGKRFIKWDADENRIIQKFGFEEDEPVDDYAYTHLFYYKGNIWIIPRKGCVIEKVDIDSEERILINCEKIEEFRVDNEEAQMFTEKYTIFNNCIYLFPYQSNGIVKIDAESNEISFMNTQIDIRELTDKIVTQNSYNENMCSIEDYIRFSLKNGHDKIVGSENYGHKIWKHTYE